MFIIRSKPNKNKMDPYEVMSLQPYEFGIQPTNSYDFFADLRFVKNYFFTLELSEKKNYNNIFCFVYC